MRTMLKLILLCSLAQFAIAQNIKPEGCGTTYKCLAPVSCDATRTVLFDAGKSYVLDIIDEIKEDCAALIKFHAYRLNWVNVKMESYGNQKTIKLIHRDATGGDKTIFTCNEIANNKWEATYQNIGKNKNIKFNNQEPHKCDFEVKLGGTNDKVYDFVSNDAVVFKNDAGLYTLSTQQAVVVLDVNCDPSNLNFDKNDPIDNKLVYMEVQYKPAEIYCEHSEISTIQYRAKPAPADYDKATEKKLICDGKRYKATTQLEEYLDARCAAHVKFFCDYDPKVPTTLDASQKKLDLTPPNKKTEVAGELKCDSSHPHLFIKGKPVFKEGTRTAPEIECNNYGGTPTWTVNGVRLTKDGPVAHCSNKLVCKDLYKIQQSSVLRGRLNTYDYPECFATGTLREHSGTKLPASNFRCDESTGEYKYDAGGVAKNVEGVKFECIYPPPVDIVAKNKKNTQTLAIGVTASGIGVGIITAALFGSFLWFARWSYRRERKRQQAADKAAYEQYALNKAEKAKLKMEKRMKDRADTKKNSSSSDPQVEEKKLKQKEWNPMILAQMTDNLYTRLGPDPVQVGRCDPANTDVPASGGRSRGSLASVKKVHAFEYGNVDKVNGFNDGKYNKEKRANFVQKEKN